MCFLHPFLKWNELKQLMALLGKPGPDKISTGIPRADCSLPIFDFSRPIRSLRRGRFFVVSGPSSTIPSPKPSPLSVKTTASMPSPSETPIIIDDEELPGLEADILRTRRAPRRDYSYRDFENMIVDAVDNETDTTSSRKRKRTGTKKASALVPVPHETIFVVANSGSGQCLCGVPEGGSPGNAMPTGQKPDASR